MALRLPCIVSSALLTAGGFPLQPSARSFPPSLGIALSGDLPLIFFSLLLLLLPLLRAHFLFPRRPFVGVDRSTQRLPSSLCSLSPPTHRRFIGVLRRSLVHKLLHGLRHHWKALTI